MSYGNASFAIRMPLRPLSADFSWRQIRTLPTAPRRPLSGRRNCWRRVADGFLGAEPQQLPNDQLHVEIRVRSVTNRWRPQQMDPGPIREPSDAVACAACDHRFIPLRTLREDRQREHRSNEATRWADLSTPVHLGPGSCCCSSCSPWPHSTHTAGFAAEDAAAPTAPSATSEPARSVPSGAPSDPDFSQTGGVPLPPPSATSPSAGNTPTIVEWLNQTVRLRDTAQALDRPSSDGKASSRIRAGAEVKAIGIVAGGQWVQIELPDQRVAYIPREAVELGDSNAARVRGTGTGTSHSDSTGGDVAGDDIVAGEHPRASHQGAQCGDPGRGRSAHPPVWN